MFKAKNESLTFDIKKMISNDDIIGLDLTTDFETLKSFIEYYEENHNVDNTIDVLVKDKNFSVKLGQFIYDKNCNARLFLSFDTDRSLSSFSYSDVLEYNQRRLVVHQEKRINNLVSLLSEKGILTDNEIDLLSSYFVISKETIDIIKEVPDLPKYLIESGETLERIEEDLEFDSL
ncbi:hypothetical protein [Enterococcus casseliflavus]|uniref:hypothetical protein n=1 Tax=Enterococcus TaxID=1350 RepID=UPI001159CF1F|nr:hypothetical protein [Enterococcus casseliflavus]